MGAPVYQQKSGECSIFSEESAAKCLMKSHENLAAILCALTFWSWPRYGTRMSTKRRRRGQNFTTDFMKSPFIYIVYVTEFVYLPAFIFTLLRVDWRQYFQILPP